MTAPGKPQGRVLICAAEFPPVGGGGVLRVAKLAKHLPALGWQVTVACSEEPLGKAVDRTLLADIPGSVRILRLRPPLGRIAARATAGTKIRLERRSNVYRFLVTARAAVRAAIAVPDRWLPWAATLARRSTADLGDPDVVVTSGPPHSAHIAGALIARRLGIPFVMDLRDEWSLRPLTRSHLPWRRAIEQRAERWCMRRAARVVVVSDISAERYLARYPWLRGRVSVIPNGFDPADLPDPESIVRDVAEDDVTLGYAGTFQVGLDLAPLFGALARVLAEGDPNGRTARFVMLGAFTPEEAELARHLIPGKALSVEPFLPHREALARAARWDVLLVVADDGASSLAGKIYEALALRKPILVVAPEGPATRLVAAAGAGVSARPGDTEGISTALRRAMAMARDPAFHGASDEFLRTFDRRLQASTWSGLLERLVQKDRIHAG